MFRWWGQIGDGGGEMPVSSGLQQAGQEVDVWL